MTPGEDAAAGRLARWLDDVDGYRDRRDRPDDDTGTSHLSADLRWGTLSPREVARTVGESTKGRAGFVRQLAWRDWYAHLLWEQPELASHALKPEMDRVPWRDDPDGLAAWQEGRTGYPIVDAGMRQLAATGWMHNRVRMITASFLVKDLLVDWRLGEAHFRRLLVDFEVSQNVGNWQWVAGTGPDAAPYFRIFNPVTQARKFDPDGEFVRRWVPELAGLEAPSVHSPWELGPLELAAAGVVLGETYPHPIVDHAEARERTLAAYGRAKGPES
jgi:deoxyribodipyrimidine photo-lyase